MNKFKRWQTWFFIILGVGINYAGRMVAFSLNLPVWLDAVGTIMTAIYLGPAGGGVCGLIFNLITSVGDPLALSYAIVSIAIGVSVGLLYPVKRENQLFHYVSVAVFTGVLAAVISTPINLIIYDGYTGNAWGDGLMDMLEQDIRVPAIRSFLGEAFVDIPDKAISVLLCMGITYYVKKVRMNRKNAVMPLVFLFLFLSPMFSGKVYAVDFSSEYTGEIYDTEDGLASIEINAVAQTGDGFVWAGTYSGLYRYDGFRFRQVHLDDRISNVKELLVDSRGYLWIGTNDSGVGCFDPVEETIRFFTVENGLPSNVIRAITEDKNGNIYLGTITQMAVISPDFEITVLEGTDFYGVYKLASCGNTVAGVNVSGNIRVFEDNRQKYLVEGDYTAIAAYKDGNYLVGTSAEYTATLRVTDEKAEIVNKYRTTNISYCNELVYRANYGGYFVACENGVGFITDEGVFTNLTGSDFNNAIDDCMVDYQGNIWFASNKHGIKKYTWNPFEDIFSRAKVAKDVVNSALIKDGLLYVAADTGLVTIDLKTYYSVPVPNPDYFRNVRIRHIMEDSKGNLWYSTYGEHGLIEVKPDRSIVTYNIDNAGTSGNRFRFTKELTGGDILVSSNGGLDFIRDGAVYSSIRENEGINAYILCAVETEDKTILAGSDGDGIYVIKNHEIIDKIDEEDGLNAPVVLKIIPCSGGYIYVTSNALYLQNGEGLRRIKSFPYSNNYDVYLPGDGNVWVMSSAGIFVVEESDLVADKISSYILLNRSRGLASSLTANSSYFASGDKLYLCCTEGIRRISTEKHNSFNENYKICVASLMAGDTKVREEDGVYHISPFMGRVQFEVAVLNYTLSNPLLHIYLEGAQDDEGITCYQRDMEVLSFTNLRYGDYVLHVQVLDAAGNNVEREEVFYVEKEPQLFERTIFRIYLMIVCFLIVLYIGWAVGNILQNASNLEKWQQEATRDALTGLLNKRGMQEILEPVLKAKKGILMLLDLDSFKPVNDIYGHEIGDRVLISMAQLMRTCTRENDILCRIGGDEFVMFLMNADREAVVEDKTRYINAELLKAARTYMGKDMNIPLGVSIGAVMVPEEGTDMAALLKKADTALYEVKNNGKHGYSISAASKESSNAESRSPKGKLDSIKKILGERTEKNGAYKLDYESLQDTYRIFRRFSKASLIRGEVIELELRGENEEKLDTAMKALVEVVRKSLRTSDIFCVNGKNSILVLATYKNDSDSSCNVCVLKIQEQWGETDESAEFKLTCETDRL
ncbi:MAG: diguanylate cyclase [Butyrivibrio sp.]|nr:diguanylate cyclase [Butyrivibrio sp.]